MEASEQGVRAYVDIVPLFRQAQLRQSCGSFGFQCSRQQFVRGVSCYQKIARSRIYCLRGVPLAENGIGRRDGVTVTTNGAGSNARALRLSLPS